MGHKKKSFGWKLVDTFDIVEYKCGLKAGDKLRLLKDIHVKYKDETPTGKIHSAGGIWTVQRGSSQDPGVLFLRQPDGAKHTWNDHSSVFDYFEKIERFFDIVAYKCGLKAGDKLRLSKDVQVKASDGTSTDQSFNRGEIWAVLAGSSYDPGRVYLQHPDGSRHTLDDDSSIFDVFEKIGHESG